jgi:hypothetical protein
MYQAGKRRAERRHERRLVDAAAVAATDLSVPVTAVIVDE